MSQKKRRRRPSSSKMVSLGTIGGSRLLNQLKMRLAEQESVVAALRTERKNLHARLRDTQLDNEQLNAELRVSTKKRRGSQTKSSKALARRRRKSKIRTSQKKSAQNKAADSAASPAAPVASPETLVNTSSSHSPAEHVPVTTASPGSTDLANAQSPRTLIMDAGDVSQPLEPLSLEATASPEDVTEDVGSTAASAESKLEPEESQLPACPESLEGMVQEQWEFGSDRVLRSLSAWRATCVSQEQPAVRVGQLSMARFQEQIGARVSNLCDRWAQMLNASSEDNSGSSTSDNTVHRVRLSLESVFTQTPYTAVREQQLEPLLGQLVAACADSANEAEVVAVYAENVCRWALAYARHAVISASGDDSGGGRGESQGDRSNDDNGDSSSQGESAVVIPASMWPVLQDSAVTQDDVQAVAGALTNFVAHGLALLRLHRWMVETVVAGLSQVELSEVWGGITAGGDIARAVKAPVGRVAVGGGVGRPVFQVVRSIDSVSVPRLSLDDLTGSSSAPKEGGKVGKTAGKRRKLRRKSSLRQLPRVPGYAMATKSVLNRMRSEELEEMQKVSPSLSPKPPLLRDSSRILGSLDELPPADPSSPVPEDSHALVELAADDSAPQERAPPSSALTDVTRNGASMRELRTLIAESVRESVASSFRREVLAPILEQLHDATGEMDDTVRSSVRRSMSEYTNVLRLYLSGEASVLNSPTSTSLSPGDGMTSGGFIPHLSLESTETPGSPSAVGTLNVEATRGTHVGNLPTSLYTAQALALVASRTDGGTAEEDATLNS